MQEWSLDDDDAAGGPAGPGDPGASAGPAGAAGPGGAGGSAGAAGPGGAGGSAGPDDRLDDPDASPWWRRSILLLTAAGVVLAGLALTGPLRADRVDRADRRGPEPAPTSTASGELDGTGPPQLVGTHLADPVAIGRPAGVTVTADGDYVGLSVEGGTSILVTEPTRVSDGSGRESAVPADPAGWLRANPLVQVTAVRSVTVAGRPVTQVDYRLPPAAAADRLARLPLFCGPARLPVSGQPDPGQDSTSCTELTAGARARATFVPPRRRGGRPVLIEARWRVDSGPAGRPPPASARMPAPLEQAYASVVATLTPGYRPGVADPANPLKGL